jgi:hypothetical protein
VKRVRCHLQCRRCCSSCCFRHSRQLCPQRLSGLEGFTKQAGLIIRAAAWRHLQGTAINAVSSSGRGQAAACTFVCWPRYRIPSCLRSIRLCDVVLSAHTNVLDCCEWCWAWLVGRVQLRKAEGGTAAKCCLDRLILPEVYINGLKLPFSRCSGPVGGLGCC